MEEAIFKTLKYFSFFSYAPSFEEIYTFLPLKTTKKKLADELKRLVKKGYLIKKIVSLPIIFNFKFFPAKRDPAPRETLNLSIYTLPPHRIFFAKRVAWVRLSREKIEKIKPFINVLKLFPQIKLVGLSGAVAMVSAKKNDDIDLFIVTAAGRLFMTRLLTIMTAEMFGMRRSRLTKKPQNKVCLNLFFDEFDMKAPLLKRNPYVAHEILQMKPLVVKQKIYERFLSANDWVLNFFPNAFHGKNLNSEKNKTDHNRSKNHLKPKKYIGDLSELLLKKLQLFLINRHKTTEFISDRQLWFFPNDFEKKLKRKGLI